MTCHRQTLSRRRFLAGAAALGASTALAPAATAPAAQGPILTRAIPSTGEAIPAIGMGSWITFNVGEDPQLRANCAEILRIFFAAGGGMIDSSPMYGSSEAVIGWCLGRLGQPEGLFSATKVWTPTMFSDGEAQMDESRALWGVRRFDLMQVHNLVDWEEHLETLAADKAAGRVRYVGVTTSHGSRHAEMARIMERQPIDFVQLTYNIADREAEARLLPLAAERGIAVIANRPFRRKALIRRFEGSPLPEWAGEIDCANWPQFLLKFIVSHPAITCAIPATSRVDHMEENMGAAYGRLPDAEMRTRMVRYVEGL